MELKSTCNYCGVGCSVTYHVDEKGVQVKGTPDYPVNKGILCPKGYKIHEPILSTERATSPMVRENGKLVPTSWDVALKTFTDKVHELQDKHGKKSFAFISTGQLYTEEMAILGQVGRVGMGIDGDGNTRQCMASAVVGYKQAFGFDAPPFTYKDIEFSDCIVLIGSNAAITHPTVWYRAQKFNKDAHVIVIDPRATDTAKKANAHLQIYPKRDLIFLYMVMNELIRRDWVDTDFVNKHCDGFEDLKAHVSGFNPEKVEEETGITKEQLNTFVERIHSSKAVSIWWTMGVNQSHQGTRTVQAIINTCLLTGNIGKPGAGPCSLTGQANAMGSRMFSNTTCLYGGRDYANAAHRQEVADILSIDVSRIPTAPTIPYDKIIEGVENGSIKGLWIICTNLLHSWVNTTKLAKMMENLEILVVQDLYANTLSAELSDVFLPAAGAGEKEGFLINSERRLGATQKFQDPPGDALTDFEIVKRVAESYGCTDVIPGWDTPAAVFKLLRECSRGKPCDFTGVRDYQHLLDEGGLQWPYSETHKPEEKERRLFEDGVFYTESGKAKLLFDPFVAPKEEPDSEFPFYLLTGRGSIVQFQSNTRTIKSGTLQKIMSDGVYMEINEKDAQRLSLENGKQARIRSRRAEITANVKISDSVPKGHIFLPFHYEETNRLVGEEFDPYSREPSFKTGAVQIEAL